MHLKISSAKWRPFCPGGDELIDNYHHDLGGISRLNVFPLISCSSTFLLAICVWKYRLGVSCANWLMHGSVISAYNDRVAVFSGFWGLQSLLGITCGCLNTSLLVQSTRWSQFTIFWLKNIYNKIKCLNCNYYKQKYIKELYSWCWKFLFFQHSWGHLYSQRLTKQHQDYGMNK